MRSLFCVQRGIFRIGEVHPVQEGHENPFMMAYQYGEVYSIYKRPTQYKSCLPTQKGLAEGMKLIFTA
jgi:hypothetical protein